MAKLELSKTDLKKLKEGLPGNFHQLMNDRLRAKGFKSYARNTINNVLNGIYKNDDIIIAAAEVSFNYQKEKQAVLKEIKSND